MDRKQVKTFEIDRCSQNVNACIKDCHKFLKRQPVGLRMFMCLVKNDGIAEKVEEREQKNWSPVYSFRGLLLLFNFSMSTWGPLLR